MNHRAGFHRASIERREFLRRGLLGVSLAGTFPIFLGKAARILAGAPGEGAGAAIPGDDRVLVVIQLSGGNDGLSTVVPYPDPAYARARTTTRVAEKDVLRLDDAAGLHPALGEMKELYDRGRLAIVQGVGYPNPTRSHFEAMEIWQAGGRSFAHQGTGWLGRAVDSTCGNRSDPLGAIAIGGSAPLALQGGGRKPVTFSTPEGYRWKGRRNEEETFRALNRPAPDNVPAPLSNPGPLDFLRRVSADAQDSSLAIRRAARNYRPRADYPGGNRLAADLRTVAGMVASGLPARIYYVSLGGFDTHANQRGTHDGLMKTLSQGIGAFQRDLEAQGLDRRVLTLTFSEFGRRVRENGSRGTDHGAAAPLFLCGARARGGLHGRRPELEAERLRDGDVAVAVDFRRVYAAVLEDCLGVPSEKVLAERFEPLGIIQGAERTRAF